MSVLQTLSSIRRAIRGQTLVVTQSGHQHAVREVEDAERNEASEEAATGVSQGERNKAGICSSSSNRYDAPLEEGQDRMGAFKVATTETAQEILPSMPRSVAQQKWMAYDILDRMEERRLVKGTNNEAYARLDKEIKKECSEAKEAWLSQECEEIEKLRQTDPSTMYKKIKRITNAKSSSSIGCSLADDGTMLVDAEDISARWTEYITRLFDDDRGPKPAIRKNMENIPPILKLRWKPQSVKPRKARRVALSFLVGYVEERPWWPIQSPNKGRKKKASS